MGSPIPQIRKPRHKLFVRSLPSCHKTKQSIRVSNSGLSRPQAWVFSTAPHCPLCLHPSILRSGFAGASLAGDGRRALLGAETPGSQHWFGPSPPAPVRVQTAQGPPTPNSAGLGMCPVALPLPSLLYPQAPPGPQLPKSQPEHHFPRTLANLERQGIRRQGNEPTVPHQRERAAPSSGAGAKVPGGDIFKQSISHY